LQALWQMVAQQSVLIVENDEQLRGLYSTALTVAGFRVREAADGLSALTSLDREAIELVILDLGLPDSAGNDVVQEIAAQAHTRSVPLLIVTDSAENLHELDLDCVLAKPASPDRLVKAVFKCLAADSEAPGPTDDSGHNM
jgi:DNA-binding response OmpR family regulator